MQTSDNGVNLIIRFEGLRLKPYYCSAGKLTIGYGHTGPDVRPGMTITKAEATELLHRDLERFEQAVARLVKVPLNSNQHAALVSFAFNTGEGALAKSTLLKRLNAGQYVGAANQFPIWNKATNPKTGKREALPGLTTRRKAERELFLADPAVTFVIPPPAQAPAVTSQPSPTKSAGMWGLLRSLFGKAS